MPPGDDESAAQSVAGYRVLKHEPDTLGPEFIYASLSRSLGGGGDLYFQAAP
jgi:hypothetical protein